MEKAFDVVALGELLIDMTMNGKSAQGNALEARAGEVFDAVAREQPPFAYYGGAAAVARDLREHVGREEDRRARERQDDRYQNVLASRSASHTPDSYHYSTGASEHVTEGPRKKRREQYV